MRSKNDDDLQFVSITEDEEEALNSQPNYDTPNENSNNNAMGGWIFKQSKHPITVVFHLLFKTLALVIYMFGNWFTSSFITIFVLCIILSAFDFWTVKNVSGRLLVGLRWWSYVREDGSTDWVFESLEDMAEISPLDSRIFWFTLYGNPIMWALLLLLGILRFNFEYIPIVGAALSMSLANLYGYTRCSSTAHKRLNKFVGDGLKSSALAAINNSSVATWLVSRLVGAENNTSSSSSNQQNNTHNNRNNQV